MTTGRQLKEAADDWLSSENGGGHLTEWADDQWLFAVVISARQVNPGPEYFNFLPEESWWKGPTPVADLSDMPRLVLAVYDVQTGNDVGFGILHSHGGTVTRLYLAVLPLRIAATTPVPTHTPTRRPSATVLPDNVRLPTGRPFARSELSADVRKLLETYPLVPGNRRTYVARSWDLGKSGHHVVTETVTSAAILSDHRLFVTSRRDVGPDTGYMMLPAAEEPRKVFWVLEGRRITRMDNPAEVLRWFSWLDRATPTATPEVPGFDDVPQDDLYRPFPALTWPAVVGDRWPMEAHSKGDTMLWGVKHRTQVTVPAGRFEDCLVLANEFADGGNCRWFCPGVGFVRDESYGWNASSWLVYDLVSFDVR